VSGTKGEHESRAGVVLIAASALIFSTAGLFTGYVSADAWTVLFWRGLFGGLFIAGYLAWDAGPQVWSETKSLGWPGIVAGACSTIGTICFVHALRLSTVAEVTVIFATAPLLAALVAWVWLRERQRPVTLLASVLAFGGVLIMMGGGTPDAAHMLGNLLALAMTLLIATMMVVMRRHRSRSMLPASGLSAFAVALVAFPMARPLETTAPDLLWLALFGTVQFGLGLLLLTLGSRKLPGARAALIGNVELPLAPAWAWLAFGAVPDLRTWLGGALVALALAIDLIATGRAGEGNSGKADRRPDHRGHVPGLLAVATRPGGPGRG
jgi:drug/metabolite transporter (DMT)-like permease